MSEQHFIQKIEQAILSSFDKNLAIEEIQEGVFLLVLDDFDYEIYCYANHIEQRIQTQTSKQCVHLDEDQIHQSLDKIVARLKGIIHCETKLFARNTVVARINKKVALEFQEEHHIQLPISGKYRYGLFYEGELVSIAVFSGGRKMIGKDENYRSFELIRFCHKNSILVIGGLSKLIKSFAKDFSANDLMTYVDLDWTQSSTLTTLGFEEKGRIEPQYYYVRNNERMIFKAKEDALLLREKNGEGFVKSNSGSIKMVLEL
ncbi:hypothetical protein [Sphingobacterium hungaricum]|uniref:Uncharacterized protein n=1 Tax=Sphingobacterium hungaricum TaxID=2082723 RepID=A0A928YPS9_9SPHI|nr:hypothetical protein [Sphingobacterium hungaricum]MBE8712872.1 hypothetical protein [Sphingobacterium hungaricum]